MIKGITKQVVVVRSPDPKLFEQAIFLVRDDVLSGGGITEKALLEEASKACAAEEFDRPRLRNLLWSLAGAGAMGILWLLSAVLV